VRARNLFVEILDEVRLRYQFALVGLAVMPEHFHLLIGEPKIGTPSTVMQVLKQRVAGRVRQKRRKRTSSAQLRLWQESPAAGPRSFWQRRFYDFNVWSRKKKAEKLNYMHMNPVKRGLVTHPKDWAWSSYCFYVGKETKIQIDPVD
jgi:putative transposase